MAARVISVPIPIPIDMYNLGFIGAGRIAESIAGGVIKSGALSASRIRTAHLGSSRKSAFESFGVKVFDRNIEVPYLRKILKFIHGKVVPITPHPTQ